MLSSGRPVDPLPFLVHQNKQQVESKLVIMDKGKFSGIFPLKCAVQKYAWGKVGKESIVARLANCNQDDTLINDEPYAELWMGTHIKGPSRIASAKYKGKSLRDMFIDHPSLLGDRVYKVYGVQLPFLFKVLSVNKSLSIQAHPTKEHASILHSKYPERYPDPNHKPELAIALTRFEALCGFRPASEVLNYLHDVPEFLAVVGQPAADHLINAEHAHTGDNKDEAVAKALKECFSCVMNCDSEVVKKQLKSLFERLDDNHLNRQDTTPYLGRLFIRIYREFPGDVGCFVIYFLNHVILEPGEAVYLAPNIPHAYLYGDCVECMACSDNVVRAGLTPKFKDVRTLCDMLDYRPRTCEDTKLASFTKPTDTFVQTYNPHVNEFVVDKLSIPEGVSSYQFAVLSGPSVAIVVSGKATATNSISENGDELLLLQQGSVFFIGANESLKVIKVNQDLLVFRAYCDLQT